MTDRPTYAQASKALLRNSLLDALRDLLDDRDWSAITMAQVAKAAGVSRQTVYNEFGSRYGLAQAYALRIAADFTAQVHTAFAANTNDVQGAMHDAFTVFFTRSAEDPLIRSLLAGEANADLLRLITTDAAPVIATAADALTKTLTTTWVSLSPESAAPLASAIARMAISYVAMPPEPGVDVAADLAGVMAPAIDAARGLTPTDVSV
ncbi:TetR family transcriptional regulator [Gordonia sp. ABSL1-1]|uniref:TetR/AcrR family transcriptional regulator n=1 Tax=Gordonia sp. ABSL1-1 TaxID=3053923 RepID=UPI00257249B9|nr:TetR family transcriptional regulator [Gordonia sp. ABSL1-1]MDL9935734.1 TetR family transcriptional regulator [Gordonia sp. ABSL1-1]